MLGILNVEDIRSIRRPMKGDDNGRAPRKHHCCSKGKLPKDKGEE